MSRFVDIAIGFFRGIGTLAWPWRLWVGLLIAVNGVAPVFFLERLEARLVLAAILVGAVIQMAIFARLGFVRLLGLGHLIVWTPLLPWLCARLGEAGSVGGGFREWLVVVIVVDAISWVIDVVDVGRWLGGERTPSLTI